ncbi:inactive serine protease PAMR1-like [Diaphorina citri]|uniref:Inactive serine protease PAMR1-like n=1 Tax=Diaphorina citri TaxID=121845 RepID=A0A3Q0IN45_DIACI|nr:inactive serine protease PAMR1-like [Diaphorina citri]
MHTCMWSLSATPGYRLELTISDVELGSNNADDCLKINDGEMVYSPVLLKVCQSGRNLSPVTTSGPQALVWPSDLPDVKGNTRLQITYRPVPGVPGCGGTFTFPEGDISSSQLQDSNR